MAMNAKDLARVLWDVNGVVLDGQSKPVPPTPEIQAYAKGYIAMLKAGIVAHLPGTVTGSASPGGPLKNGAASGGKIAGLLGPTMASVAAGAGMMPPVAAQLAIVGTAIATYLMASGLVEFKKGSIEGTSGESGGSPGPLGAGKGSVGRITNIDGATMAQTIASLTGQSGPLQVKFYDALAKYTMKNAEVTYGTGTIAGSMNGGKLSGGAGAGGTIK